MHIAYFLNDSVQNVLFFFLPKKGTISLHASKNGSVWIRSPSDITWNSCLAWENRVMSPPQLEVGGVVVGVAEIQLHPTRRS